MPLKINSTDKSGIEKAVLHWIDLLAEEKYEEAFELTLHNPYYQWTPQLIKSVINGYGLPDEIYNENFKVSPAELALSESENHRIYKDITFFTEPREYESSLTGMKIIGEIYYDLPINGYWSDLTVQFTIFSMLDFFLLELNEIHVF